MLGANRITALTDPDSRNARTMNAAYETIRDAELRKHPWSFAIKRAQLAADATAPTFGPAVSYTLPSDFLRLLSPDANYNSNDSDWKIEGKKLLTDDSAPLNIRYIYRVTDPTEMDTLFHESLSAALAVATCEEITQSTSKLSNVAAIYDTNIKEAKRANAIETVSDEPPEDTWVTARL